MSASKYIKSPRKKNVSSQPQKTGPEIPKDLADQWAAVEACATAFNVIQNGMFAPNYLTVVTASLGFLGKLHESSLAAVRLHPKCELIPEIKTMIENEKKQKDAQDGQEIQAQ